MKNCQKSNIISNLEVLKIQRKLIIIQSLESTIKLFMYAPCSSAFIWNQRRFYDVYLFPCLFEKAAGPLDLGYRGQCHTTIGSR